MKSSTTVRLAALAASIVISVTLVQSMALLGHPRPAEGAQVAQVAQAGVR
jgi:hypothetical protein